MKSDRGNLRKVEFLQHSDIHIMDCKPLIKAKTSQNMFITLCFNWFKIVFRNFKNHFMGPLIYLQRCL